MQRLWRWKKSLFALASLALLYFSIPFLLITAVDWYMQKRCLERFGAEFTGKAYAWSGTSIIIEQARLSSKKSLAEGGYDIAIPKMQLSFSLLPLQGEILSTLTLDRPLLQLGERSEKLLEALSLGQEKKGYLSFKPHLKIHEGTFKLEAEKSFIINADMDLTAGPCGTFDLSFEQAGIRQKVLIGTLKKEDEDKSLLYIDLDNSDAKALFKTLDVLYPLNFMAIAEGTVEGFLKLEVLKKDIHLRAAKGFIKDFKGSYSDLQALVHIPKATFTWQENFGALHIENEGAFYFGTALENKTELKNVQAHLSSDKQGIKALTCQGLLGYGGMHFESALRVKKVKDQPLDLTLNIEGKEHKLLSLTAVGNPLKSALCHVTINQAKSQELQLLKPLLSKYFPNGPLCYIQPHALDLSLKAKLKEGAIEEVAIETMDAKGVALKYLPLGLDIAIAHVKGDITFGLSPLTNYPTQGKLDIEGLTAKTLQNVTLLENIFTKVAFDQGNLQKMVATGEFSGLEGSLEIDPEAIGQELSLQVEGKALHLARFLPLDTYELVKKKYSGDIVQIVTTGAKAEQSIAFKGVFTVINESQEERDHLNFNFTLNLPEEDLKHSPKWLVDKGEFHAKGLALNKFVAPFIFEREEFTLKGHGDVEGRFDQETLKIDYVAKDFRMESKNLCLDIPQLAANCAKTQAFGFHTFYLTNGKHYGELTIENGQYFEKYSGLYFNGISTKVFSDDSIIHLKDLKTRCCGLNLSGDVRIDCSEPLAKTFGVAIDCHSMEGKFSSLRYLLSHFKNLKDVDLLPLDGDIGLGDKGWHLNFAFSPEGMDFDTTIEGYLSEGSLQVAHDLSLQDVGFKFAYNHAKSFLAFEQIVGKVPVGEKQTAYALNRASIAFSDLKKGKASFDIPFSDEYSEVLRLQGETNSILQGIDVHFNSSQSHIFGCHPLVCELSLDKECHMTGLCIALPFELSAISQHLCHFAHTGFFKSIGLKEQHLDSLKRAAGAFLINLKYSALHDQFLYTLNGNNCHFDTQPIEKFSLTGKKKGSLWSIDKLQIDSFSLAADLLKERNMWIFKFLGMQFEEAVLAGMQGEYSVDTGLFEGQLNLLEIDFDKLKSFKALQSFCKKFCPLGTLKASGPLRLEQIEVWPYWHVETALKASVVNPGLLGLNIFDMDAFNVQWKSSEKLKIDGIKASFNAPSKDLIPDQLDMSEQNFISALDIELDPWLASLDMGQLQFSFTPQCSAEIVYKLHELFPQKVSKRLAETIASCKRQGRLEGKCSLNTQDKLCRLELAKGLYQWNGNEYPINNFALEYAPKNLRIIFNSYYQEHPFWCFLHSACEDLSQGSLFLSDTFLTRSLLFDVKDKALVIEWSSHPQFGFCIDKAVGKFAGMDFNLALDTSLPPCKDKVPLVGKLSIDLPSASRILSPFTRQGFKDWQIGHSYDLIGRWFIKKDNKRSADDSFEFIGALVGENIQCRGYRFASLQAQVTYSFDRVELTDIKVRDAACDLEIEKATLVDQGFGFELDAKLVNVRNFRPCLLCSLDSSEPLTMTPLVMHIDLNNLHGLLADPNSFTASGAFSFNNSSKKASHPLFAIPTEIIHRLGLDLCLLSPVSGLVYYTICDGKIFLSKLKDVYSEGKFSKFYLDTSLYYSFIDFDGNINVQVRMRQYNLLFKLAELFTVNVCGTLKQPHYLLKRLPKKSHGRQKRPIAA